MTIYNRQSLENLLVLEQVKVWQRMKLIDSADVSNILLLKQPAYNRSHLLYRIGIFVLTLITISSVSGIAGLVLEIFDNDQGYKFFMLFSAFAIFGILIFFIKEKNHFKSGVDDALLYVSLGLFIAVIQLFFNSWGDDFVLFFALTAFPVLVIASIFFIDRLLAVLSFISLITIVFLLTLKTGVYGKLFLPFILMFTAGVIYYVVSRLRKNLKYFFWTSCLTYIGYCCLIVFYLAGNYYVVREASVLLMGFSLTPGSDIPYAFIFYGLTFLVPAVYIFYGLKNRKYSFLNFGLLFMLLGILTIRYYYSMLPIEIALVSGGLFCLVFGWLVLQILKVPKYGISADEDKSGSLWFGMVTESLVIAQTFAPVQPTGDSSSSSSTEFGGGKFGGGGAEGKF